MITSFTEETLKTLLDRAIEDYDSEEVDGQTEAEIFLGNKFPDSKPNKEVTRNFVKAVAAMIEAIEMAEPDDVEVMECPGCSNHNHEVSAKF